MIGALGRGRERGNAVKGNVEYRSRAAARICRESPLTEWSATLAREGNGRPFPSAPRRVRGVVRRGEVPPFGACADGPHLMSDAANE